MTSIKTSVAQTLGVLGALILAPFVALFGLVVLGFTFGLSLIGVAVLAIAARCTGKPDQQAAAADDLAFTAWSQSRQEKPV